jgi:thiol-disulfide isomerase/thioredoxin
VTTAEAPRAARVAGRIFVAALAALLVINLSWIARHCDALRPLSRGDLAPGLTLPTADGRGERTLDELRGKVVLIDFWATWCGPCERTLPALRRLHERHAAAGFEVFSVNEDAGEDGADKALAYARDRQLPFTVLHDRGGAAAEAYRVDVFPTMLLLDKRGRVRQVHVGAASVDRLERELDEGIRTLLAE